MLHPLSSSTSSAASSSSPVSVRSPARTKTSAAWQMAIKYSFHFPLSVSRTCKSPTAAILIVFRLTSIAIYLYTPHCIRLVVPHFDIYLILRLVDERSAANLFDRRRQFVLFI